MLQKVTIKDVAKSAGVSASTVSRVLSGNSSISEKTCKAVRKAAAELNYTPNTVARSLRCEKSHSIGVVFRDISGEFYASCASSLLKYARLRDYTVLFTESGGNKKYASDGIRAFMDRCVDGLIFIGESNDYSLIQDISIHNIPIVTGDRNIDGIPSIIFDNRDTVRSMVDGLYNAGCRRFVYVGEITKGQNNLSERYNGYIDALEKYNNIETMSILDAEFHVNKPLTAYRAFSDKIIDFKPDAIVTSNDLIAQGIISAAHANGINIPKDMFVTGFDNTISSAYFVPSITTVFQDVDELARACFETLLNMIDKKDVASKVIPQKIIIRDSAPLLQQTNKDI